jgi:zinc protease
MKTIKTSFVNYMLLLAIIGLGLLWGLVSCAGPTPAPESAAPGLEQAPSEPGTGEPSIFMSAVRSGTLSNGLRYYILENKLPENRAFLTLAVNAGSILEQDNEQGLAHFVEHMAFNGTERFPEAELLEYLRSLGMSFGADANAYTSFEETVYSIEVPTETNSEGKKSIPEKALEIMDDWSHAISFDAQMVEDERAIILGELRDRLGPSERIMRQMFPVLLHDSPYPDRWPIGLADVVQNAPVSRLKGFYEKWYRPDNMALIAVGDFDGAALEASLPDYFDAPRPGDRLNRPYYELPAPEKGRLEVSVINEDEYPYVEIDLYFKGQPLAQTGDEAEYRRSLVNNLMSGMISQRVNEAVLNPDTPYAGAGVWEDRYGQRSNFFVMGVVAKPGLAKESLQALMALKESIQQYGFTNSEIERAKRGVLSNLNQAVSEADRQASSAYVNAFTEHYLRNALVPDAAWELATAQRLLPEISADEIRAALVSYFEADDLSVFAYGPGAELPTASEVRAIISGAKEMPLTAPPEEEVEKDLMSDDEIQAIRPGTISTKALEPETGASVWTLSNGARVILQPTTNKNNEMILYAQARGGYTSASGGQEISARLAADLLNFSGLGQHSRVDLMKILADKQASLSWSVSQYSRYFSGAASVSSDLETLFQLLYLNFTQPRIEETAAKAMLDQYRTTLIAQDADPVSYWSNEINRIVFGNDPALRPLELADLDRANTADALAFVKKGLNPADYLFVFSGNLDLAAMEQFVSTYIASIPRLPQAWNSYADRSITRPSPGVHKLYKGREAQSFVFLAYFAAEAYDEAKSAAADVLTEYLNIKLIQEIREKMGGAYSVGASVSQSALPPGGELLLQSSFGCDPARASDLSNAVAAQVSLVAEGTIDADAFTKAVTAVKSDFEEAMQSNAFIAQSYATLQVTNGLPFNRLKLLPDLYAAVKPMDIQALAASLEPHGPVEIILYPEGWN